MEVNDAMKLVKPVGGGDSLEDDYGDPEDYIDDDAPDFLDESDEIIESEGTDDDEEGEEGEEPEDLRAAFIRAQAELQQLRQEQRDSAVRTPQTPEEWVEADPLRGPLGEDGKATPEQREAFYNHRVLAAEMKVARMEVEREAGITMTFLDMLSDAGVNMQWEDPRGFATAMKQVEGNIIEVLDQLLEMQVKEKMSEVEKRWGVGKLDSAQPKAPKRGAQQSKAYKEAKEAVLKDRNPNTVARLIRAHQRMKEQG